MTSYSKVSKYANNNGNWWDLRIGLDYYDQSYFYLYGGNDFLSVHADRSWVSMGVGNDLLHITGANDTIIMSDGDDALNSTANTKRNLIHRSWIELGNGADRAYVTGSGNRISGGNHNDSIAAMGDDNIIDFGAGFDTGFIKGNRNTVIDVDGSRSLMIRGFGNSFTGSAAVVGSDTSISGTNNTVTVNSKAQYLGNVFVSGLNNTVKGKYSYLFIGFADIPEKNQYTTVYTDSSTMNFECASNRSFGEMQGINCIGGHNIIKIEAYENSFGWISLQGEGNTMYLQGIVDANESGLIDGQFTLDLYIKSGAATFVDDLTGVNVVQRSGQPVYDFVGTDSKVLGTLRVRELVGTLSVVSTA